MRCALASRLGGYGSHNKLRDSVVKVYNITVKPKGRRHMVKEALRYGSAEPTKSSKSVHPKVPYDNAVVGLIVEERQMAEVFRDERLAKFNKHKHVPALVSEQFVPSWRGASNAEDEFTPAAQMRKRLEEEMEDMRQKITSSKTSSKANSSSSRRTEDRMTGQSTMVMPTISIAMKRAEKVVAPDRREGSFSEDWRLSSVSEAREVLHPHVPDLENGGAGCAWDELRERTLREEQESKSLWLAGDVKPGGKSVTPAAEEISKIRERSKHGLNSLVLQYGRKREAFQKAPDSGAMKSFEKFIEEHRDKVKASTEEATKAAEQIRPKLQLSASFAGALSHGLGKHRGTTAEGLGKQRGTINTTQRMSVEMTSTFSATAKQVHKSDLFDLPS